MKAMLMETPSEFMGRGFREMFGEGALFIILAIVIVTGLWHELDYLRKLAKSKSSKGYIKCPSDLPRLRSQQKKGEIITPSLAQAQLSDAH
ncbi:MAG: hypothetical protein QF600_09550 [Verrucomicrobiota bacterium]|nr:hypothetical protein [Verrucomicrobiota bacterium]